MTAPVCADLARRLGPVLASRHASHLTAPIMGVLTPHLRVRPVDPVAVSSVVIDVRLVAQLAGVLGKQRIGDLLIPVLATARPWLTVQSSPATTGKRGARRRPSLTDVPALTDRQQQVLEGMSMGLTNGQIARQLFITEDTVKTFARRMFVQIGARDRAHAVRRGFELGLLTSGDVELVAS